METTKSNTLGPFVLLAFTFFIVGFMTVINGQCQGPLKQTFLAHAGELKNTLTTLISFFFFLGFLVNGSTGGRWINQHGYKTALLRGLVLMITGLLTYLAAALFAEHLNGLCLPIGAERIPYGFFIFLMGSFLIGSSAAVLQTVIIPYVSAYELPHTQSVQRVNITCAVNSLGTTIAPFFVTGILFGGVSLTEIEAGQLQLPFLIIALCIVGIRYVISRLHLPDMAHTRMMKHEQQRMRRSIWSFRHLKWGVVAIFFYVGAEVAVGTNINLHAMETTNSEEALSLSALLATLYWSGMMIGRIVSGFLYNVSARTQLTVTTIIATLLILVGTATNNLWILVSVGLFHSVMWGSIFTLAVKGLKKYTSKASGLFMTGVFGGAVFPILQGIAADLSGSWQWTWLLIAVCELVMLGYALFGSRIRQADLEDID